MADFIAPDNDCLRYVKAPLEHAIVVVESSFNPFAIGVVGGALARQPRNKAEAVATALALKEQGYKINKFKVTKGNCYEIYGLDKDGRKVEIYHDPVSGKAVKSEYHD